MHYRILPIAFAFLFFGCHKTKQAATTPLLTKTESTIGSETVTTTFTYSNGLLNFMQAAGMSGGKVVDIKTSLQRNGQNIEKIVVKTPAFLTTFKSDSIVYRLNYTPFSSQYTSMVYTLNYINGNIEYDSIYFSYDVAGLVSTATRVISTNSGAFTEAERNEFTYAGKNLIRCKNYIAGTLFLEQTVAYDNKYNPMRNGMDWLILGSTRNNRKFEQASWNNATTISYNKSGTIDSTAMSYTYNEYSLPAVRTNAVTGGGTQTITYTYQ